MFHKQNLLYNSPEKHDNTADAKNAEVDWPFIPHTNGTFLSLWPISTSNKIGEYRQLPTWQRKEQKCTCKQ
jgi:hypothetical protein